MFAIISAALIVLSVILALLLTNRGDRPEIILPDVQPPVSDSTDTDSDSAPLSAEVSPETVQAVIATLSRPDSYSRTLTILSAWDGGSTQYRISAWVKGDRQRLSVECDSWSYTKNILITDEEISIWYGSDSSHRYTAARSFPGGAEQLGDEVSMIPTYEDILALDADRITRAEYTERNGWKIMVSSQDEVTGYIWDYYVSIDTGLLEAAEARDGDRTVYLMEAGAAELNAPDDALFDPDQL